MSHILEKIKTLDELIQIIPLLKDKGQKIVFTNGCFDIIHAGHVLYLEEASLQGDILILGLNSDASVKRLKGDSRPVNNEQDRAVVISALQSVSYVVIFDQDTPFETINALIPDVLVKGGDWPIEQIVGADIVINHGGVVKSLSFTEGKSTTNIINKVKQNESM